MTLKKIKELLNINGKIVIQQLWSEKNILNNILLHKKDLEDLGFKNIKVFRKPSNIFVNFLPLKYKPFYYLSIILTFVMNILRGKNFEFFLILE